MLIGGFGADPAAVEKFLHDERVRQLLVELGERYASLSTPLPDDLRRAVPTAAMKPRM